MFNVKINGGETANEISGTDKATGPINGQKKFYLARLLNEIFIVKSADFDEERL